MSVVVTRIPDIDRSDIEAVQGLGVATIHEAQGQKGLLAS